MSEPLKAITDGIALERNAASLAAHKSVKMRLETVAVRAGAEIDQTTGALAPPLHLSTTFEHGPASEAIHGFLYVRQKNPTQSRLEAALRDLEGGTAALVFSSGMAAAAAVLQTLPPGSHVIFSDDIYIDVRNLIRDFLPGWGVESAIEDLRDSEAVKRAIRPNTKLVWLETPSNPLMKILDISAVADIAHQVGAQLLVDSTFATPILQRPLALCADIVLHSTTKYCGGHSDVQGGCLVVKSRELLDKLFHVARHFGSGSFPVQLLADPAWFALATVSHGKTLRERVSRCQRPSKLSSSRICVLSWAAFSSRTRHRAPPNAELRWDALLPCSGL
jgi:cystathionine beta-lyase/cystathionine gamma-synthase